MNSAQRIIAALDFEIDTFADLLAHRLHRDPGYAAIQQIPGVGQVLASMKHELAQVRRQGSGAIVNCSSLAGLVANPKRASYSATKHGILGPSCTPEHVRCLPTDQPHDTICCRGSSLSLSS